MEEKKKKINTPLLPSTLTLFSTDMVKECRELDEAIWLAAVGNICG